MTPEQFCYWLRGQFELEEGETELTQGQIRMIDKHLKSVFTATLAPSRDTRHDKGGKGLIC